MARPAKEGLYQDKKSKFWYCRFYTPKGKLKRCSTKEVEYNNALAVYKKLRSDAECEPVRGEVITVNTILSSYDHVRGQFLLGQSSYKKGTKQILIFFDGIAWDALKIRGGEHSVNAYITKRVRGDGVKPATVNREISILSAAANVSIDEGYEIDNVWVGKKLPVTKHQYHWLTVDQAISLLKACQGRGISDHLYDYVQIALGTGMRMSEILKLEQRDVRLDLNELWLRTSKSGQPHSIPMVDAVRQATKSRLDYCAKQHSNYLFCNPHTHKPIKTIIKPFKNGCIRAGIVVSDKKKGIEGFRLHDTRHTVASWLIQNGASIEQVADLLNHSDIRTTQKYAHHAVDARKGTVGKLPNI